ncbi:MAG: glutamate racemase [bacterium]
MSQSDDYRSAPIGVFDSGLGGLSVAREIRASLPGESLIYFADNAYAPYGELSRSEVLARVLQVAETLQQRGVKALVMACNTATAVAAEELRASTHLPVIAMEPAIKPAAALTNSDCIGVLATAGTLASERYANLRDRHGKHVQVIAQDCTDWVRKVETGSSISVASKLAPLRGEGADVLVLGCTHFPFLRAEIEAEMGDSVQIVDPAPAVARRLKQVLVEASLDSVHTREGTITLLTSGNPVHLSTRVKELLGWDFSVEKV